MLLKNVLEECGHSDPVLVNVVNVLSLVGLQSAERMPQVMEPYMTAVSGWPCRIRLCVLLDAEENNKAGCKAAMSAVPARANHENQSGKMAIAGTNKWNNYTARTAATIL
jgi:hypothetical protein